MSKIESLIDNFEKTLERLSEALEKEKSDIVRDSAIKRFELVFDTAWKTLKTYLEEYHNAICNSPKSCFKEAVHQGILAHDSFWVDIVSERNYTAHIYKESLAEQIYKDLPQALKHFQQLFANIKEQIKK